MKKNYEKPTMIVVKIQHSGIICQSKVGDTESNAGMKYGGAGTDEALSRGHNVWEDDGE